MQLLTMNIQYTPFIYVACTVGIFVLTPPSLVDCATTLTVGASMASMSARNTAQIAGAISPSASQGTALQSTLTRTINGINSTMIASVAGKANNAKHIWLGGCTSSGGGCWRDQCMNGVELDTARPKFFKRTNTRMRAIVTGFFRMNLWAMISTNWAHISVSATHILLARLGL